MKTPELIWRLRVEGGFALTPLIDSTGAVTGAHLTRFNSDGYVEVLQIWDGWGAFARIPDRVNPDAPLVPASAGQTRSGPLEQIAAPLLRESAPESFPLADAASERPSGA